MGWVRSPGNYSLTYQKRVHVHPPQSFLGSQMQWRIFQSTAVQPVLMLFTSAHWIIILQILSENTGISESCKIHPDLGCPLATRIPLIPHKTEYHNQLHKSAALNHDKMSWSIGIFQDLMNWSTSLLTTGQPKGTSILNNFNFSWLWLDSGYTWHSDTTIILNLTMTTLSLSFLTLDVCGLLWYNIKPFTALEIPSERVLRTPCLSTCCDQ